MTFIWKSDIYLYIYICVRQVFKRIRLQSMKLLKLEVGEKHLFFPIFGNVSVNFHSGMRCVCILSVFFVEVKWRKDRRREENKEVKMKSCVKSEEEVVSVFFHVVSKKYMSMNKKWGMWEPYSNVSFSAMSFNEFFFEKQSVYYPVFLSGFQENRQQVLQA